MHLRRAAVPLLLLTLLGTACSSTPPAPAASPAPVAPPAVPVVMSDVPALHRAVEVYSAAYLGGQGATAWQLLSPRCQQLVTQTQLADLANAAAALYGPEQVLDFTLDQPGNPALVSYRYPTPALDQHRQRWVSDNGQWRYDNC